MIVKVLWFLAFFVGLIPLVGVLAFSGPTREARAAVTSGPVGTFLGSVAFLWAVFAFSGFFSPALALTVVASQLGGWLMFSVLNAIFARGRLNLLQASRWYFQDADYKQPCLVKLVGLLALALLLAGVVTAVWALWVYITHARQSPVMARAALLTLGVLLLTQTMIALARLPLPMLSPGVPDSVRTSAQNLAVSLVVPTTVSAALALWAWRLDTAGPVEFSMSALASTTLEVSWYVATFFLLLAIVPFLASAVYGRASEGRLVAERQEGVRAVLQTLDRPNAEGYDLELAAHANEVRSAIDRLRHSERLVRLKEALEDGTDDEQLGRIGVPQPTIPAWIAARRPDRAREILERWEKSLPTRGKQLRENLTKELPLVEHHDLRLVHLRDLRSLLEQIDQARGSLNLKDTAEKKEAAASHWANTFYRQSEDLSKEKADRLGRRCMLEKSLVLGIGLATGIGVNLFSSFLQGRLEPGEGGTPASPAHPVGRP